MSGPAHGGDGVLLTDPTISAIDTPAPTLHESDPDRAPRPDWLTHTACRTRSTSSPTKLMIVAPTS